MNKLFFLYEGYDNYWNFSLPGRVADIFELIVDADLSGGPFVSGLHPLQHIEGAETFYSFHGVHAQNYHIFTPPAPGKDWTIVWGSQSFIKRLPYANAAYRYDFQPNESGKLILEFMITPFDYVGHEGPERAVESRLYENKRIGMSWAVIDYDDVNSDKEDAFWSLSHHKKMYGDASCINVFRLMPLEDFLRDKIRAEWDFRLLDEDRPTVAFTDRSEGEITSWHWDFGDGATSTEQHPIHTFTKKQRYGETVTLQVKGPEGTSTRTRVWDIIIK